LPKVLPSVLPSVSLAFSPSRASSNLVTRCQS
jgi:hypothetical protein